MSNLSNGGRNGSSGPRQRVAGGPVGYKHGMRAGHKKERVPKGKEETQGSDPGIGREEERSCPCQEKGQMNPHRGVASCQVGHSQGMRDGNHRRRDNGRRGRVRERMG